MSVETDRELLELAAKAAGYVIVEHARNGSAWAWVYPFGAKPDGDGDYPIFKWNPLHDDGDALRLAVKLEMDFVRYSSHAVSATGRSPTHGSPATYVTQRQELDGDPYAATRRVIVRAAAAIGRAMP